MFISTGDKVLSWAGVAWAIRLALRAGIAFPLEVKTGLWTNYSPMPICLKRIPPCLDFPGGITQCLLALCFCISWWESPVPLILDFCSCSQIIVIFSPEFSNPCSAHFSFSHSYFSYKRHLFQFLGVDDSLNSFSCSIILPTLKNLLPYLLGLFFHVTNWILYLGHVPGRCIQSPTNLLFSSSLCSFIFLVLSLWFETLWYLLCFLMYREYPGRCFQSP